MCDGLNKQNKILKMMFGHINEGDEWRINTMNQTYIKLFNLTDFEGSVCRMNEAGVPKRVLKGKSKGKRWIGKPKERWLDGVERDLSTLERI